MAFYPNYSSYDDYDNYRGYGSRWDQNYLQNNQRRRGSIPGKFIREERDIRPNDVPADGSVAFFPSENYDFIIAKGWNDQGDRMDVVKYVPAQRVNQEPQVSPEMQLLQDIMARQDRIEKMLVSSGLFDMQNQEKVVTSNDKQTSGEKKND